MTMGVSKESLAKLYDYVMESRVERAVFGEKLDQILQHTSETNGRVHKLELKEQDLKDALVKLKRDLDEQVEVRNIKLDEISRQFNDEMSRREAKIMMRVWKAVALAALIGSFVWIKESRDTILHILSVIL